MFLRSAAHHCETLPLTPAISRQEPGSGHEDEEERFIRIVAWSSFTAARHFARIVARKIGSGNRAEERAVAA